MILAAIIRRASVHPSTFSIIFYEITKPIELKFNPMDWGAKVCSNSPHPVHMTKMATMPIYGKNV